MTNRTILSIVACAALLGTTALPLSPALAAPNSHANSHANGGNGNGNGDGNGNADKQSNGHGSVVHQYALANGLKQGDVASSLKSWNSLNANPNAFLNKLDNPNSLHGKQAKYICDNATSQTALTDFTNLGGDPANPPSADDFAAAQAYLSAVALLGGADPATVAADPESSPEQIDAANLILASTLTGDTAQGVVDQYNAWTLYQGAEGAAEDSFLAASVSYKGATYDDAMTALRGTVDGVITQKGLDTTSLCGTETEVAEN
jgi:hypothetical protein